MSEQSQHKTTQKARRCRGGCAYSRAMNQPYPRRCVRCGQPEPAAEQCPHTMLADEGTQIVCCDCGAGFADMAEVEAARAAMEASDA